MTLPAKPEKPMACPFCGAKAAAIEMCDASESEWCVECQAWIKTGRYCCLSIYRPTKNLAVSDWNRVCRAVKDKRRKKK